MGGVARIVLCGWFGKKGGIAVRGRKVFPSSKGQAGRGGPIVVILTARKTSWQGAGSN